jgi:hypothetical protein
MLRNEELRDLYSSPSIIRIIKSRRMRWVGHVARKGGEECGTSVSPANHCTDCSTLIIIHHHLGLVHEAVLNKKQTPWPESANELYRPTTAACRPS